MDIKEVAASLVTEAPAPTSTPETEPEVNEDQAHDAEEREEIDEAEDQEVEETEDESEEEPEADPEESDEVDTFTLKIDGSEVEVTLDDLVQSYQIEGAAQKRLQEATEARKAAVEDGRKEGLTQAQTEIQTQRQEIETARKQLAELVNVIGGDMFAPKVQQPDPAMQDSDPVRYLTEEAAYRNDQERIRQLQAQVTQTIEARRAEQERHQAEARQRGQTELLSKRPDLRDPEAQKQFTANVRRAQNYAGFTTEEVNAYYDHRGMIVLDKLGELLAQVQGEGPTPAQKVVKKAKRPLPPGAVVQNKTRRQKQQRVDRDRAKKTGDYRDVAKLLVQDAPRKR